MARIRVKKPKKAYRKRYKKKRIPRRKHYGISTKLNLPSKRATTLLSYVDVGSSASAGVTPWVDTWRTNGLFDPYVATGGHQPYLFDQVSALYTKYQVNACRVSVEGIIEVSGKPSGCIVMLVASLYATLPTTDPFILYEKGVNQRFMKQKIISDSNSKFKLNLYVRNHEVLGIPKAEYNEEIYKGSNTADPVKGCYIHLLAFAPDKTSVVTVDYVIKLNYYCEFSNQVVLSQS